MNAPDPIARLNAALQGRYRIERKLGEGGMATVYLADDLKHERKVALKVLKPELAAVVGAERFLAEIKTTANLQHPHILPLHDSGTADDLLFYVMPFVEGESLRDRLDREHQLPVEDAVRITVNLAEALDYAHRKGVIHRDIKPANVLLLDGKPVISDFGIALAVSTAGQGRMTETGLSLGTPHYMSPEQATGDLGVGAGTDIYSLGCVLYEMLVGEPPYTGSTAQAILGKIIAGERPSATKHRSSVPRNVDSAIRKALEKVPADRFVLARDFSRALGDRGFGEWERVGVRTGTDAGRWKRAAMILAATSALFAGALGLSLLRSVERPVTRYGIDVPLFRGRLRQSAGLALSPDGTSLVYEGIRMGQAAASDDAASQLWYRPLDQLEPTPLPGTEGALDPVFSPDGRKVAFETVDGAIRTVALTGESPLTIADRGTGLGMGGIAWGPGGYIYATGPDRELIRIPETGGEPQPFTTLDSTRNELVHARPQVLPSGRGVLFTIAYRPDLGAPPGPPGPSEIAVADAATGDHRVLAEGVFARHSASGHLIYVTATGALMAAPFDEKTLDMGDAALLADGVTISSLESVRLALSENGTLVYERGGTGVRSDSVSEFVWVTRSGEVSPAAPGFTFPQHANQGWRLSPEGNRIAFNYLVDGNSDVRVKRLPDGPEERITFSPDNDMRPFWTPDGEHVSYFSNAANDPNGWKIWTSRADGIGDPVLVLDGERHFAQGSWSSDGERLLLRSSIDPTSASASSTDAFVFRPRTDSRAQPLLASPDYNEGAPVLSPDGRWLAYHSNETGRFEVFVRPFPDVDSRRVRVSVDGGRNPIWTKGGSELFYRTPEPEIVAAAFDPATGRLGSQQALFYIPAGYSNGANNDFYDVTSDGGRVLMVRRREPEDRPEQIVLVQNFFEELRRLVPN